MNRAAKWTLTAGTIYYGFLPILVDVSGTHLFHPEWSPHARYHMVWLLSVGFMTACLALWLLWAKGEPLIAGLLGLLFTGGFFVAALTRGLYGGAFTEPGGVEEELFGVDVGVYAFGGDWLLIAVSLYFLVWRPQGAKVTH